MVKRLKQKDIADFRTKKLITQGGRCTLCQRKVSSDKACLDHSHQTGNIRDVLCRNCNGLEGKIMNLAYRSGINNPLLFLMNVIKYQEVDYSDNQLHPTHLTPNEKEVKKLTKLMRARKKQETKDKYQVKLDALYEMVRRENENT